MSSDETFYKDLPEFADFVDVCDDSYFTAVPASWDVVITDVVGSTKAIEKGRYKDVNAAGVASIVAVRNTMRDLDIPYVFGGDGATLLTPASRRLELIDALQGVQSTCWEGYQLQMRTGIVPIRDLDPEFEEIRIARFASSPDVSFAMLQGRGVDVAETWIKAPNSPYLVEPGPGVADFKGFECRWQPVPSRHGIVASIIVRALSEDLPTRSNVYRLVLNELGSLLQVVDDGRPVAMNTVKLASSRDNFDTEVLLKAGTVDSAAIPQIRKGIQKQVRNGRVLTALGISMGGFHAKRYKQELLANTDFRKFDNALRMHIDLRRGQLTRLKEVLQQAEDDGFLVYGIHTADHSLLTCAVDSFQGQHIHFVDGGHGGYALAAKRIKVRRNSSLGTTATQPSAENQ